MNKPCLLGLLLASPLLSASDDFEGAVLYEHGDYGGSSLTLYPGEGIPDLSAYWESTWDTWNDEISSVAVWGPVTVYLYTDVNYRGQLIEITDHVDQLGPYGWNDRASSVWVDWTPTAWEWQEALQAWIYPDGDWIYHDHTLGWLYDLYFDYTAGAGWLFDSRRGWLYTTRDIYPWFYNPTDGWLSYLPGSADPRWWYQATTRAWIND